MVLVTAHGGGIPDGMYLLGLVGVPEWVLDIMIHFGDIPDMPVDGMIPGITGAALITIPGAMAGTVGIDLVMLITRDSITVCTVDTTPTGIVITMGM